MKKVSSVLKETKDEEVVIIDSDLYPILEDKYGDVIPNWEKSPKPKGEFRVPIVGIFVGDRMKSIDKLQKGDSLKLIRDPKNSYDPYAIKIMTIDNKQVGFIAARWATVFSKKIDDGFTYEASLSKKDIQNSCIYINLTTKTVHHEDILKKIPFL